MSPFLPTQLEIHHIQAIVRGLYQLAQSDGLHQTELVMLREFYQTCQQEAHALTSFDELINTEFDPEHLADVLDTTELKHSFLQSCLFLSYADGTYSTTEHNLIVELAGALGVEHEQLSQLQEAVTDHLLQQISRIENVDALKEVAARLNS